MTVTVTIANRAHTTAQEILDSLADPDHVRFLPDKPALRQRPSSMGGGAAGVALAHVEAARTGHGPWESARTWIARALSEPINGSNTATLWSGAPALGLLTTIAATSPARLARARARLAGATTRLTLDRLSQANTRIDRGQGPSLAEFDLIQGLTGLAVYHLHTHPEAPITRHVLAYLVRLSRPLPDDPHRLPGWWTEHSPHNSPAPEFPGGHLNLGMAHGIAAPLAVLSLALRHGVTVDGHTDAIGRILDVLDARRHAGPRGTWWPYYLTPQRWENGPTTAACEQRPTWCYGTPGLARAQQLAGIALHDPHRQAMAEQTMADCLRDASQLDTLADLGLCHGWAGLLHCAWRINTDAPDTPLTQDLDRIATTLLDRLEGEPHPDPEFLDGRAGIALALHTYANGAAPGVPWDAHLALA
ncbi:lanthionine synthetase C family protein [Nocardiopsis alba]|uniref:Lanthionine synthetase C-like family protein n=1 Tax=Nocardiopsis alba (strain ATCC BAA-2165 / BE74) TaxID=1205910 RepID=J7L7P9_NOCAA|nr:lanthionine synthetase C family protein [Nocardiopsis alba]AFR06829.1 lanthionine synthetase C-like family protein [Nocardiopsis alba ATCC BAA-2165]